MIPRQIICLFLALLGLIMWAEPARAESVEEEEQSRRGNHFISNEGFGLRVGLLLNGLMGAEEAVAFRYFDLGFRYKAGEYYVDVRAPALTMLGDGLLFIGSEILRNQYFEPLFERFNDINAMTYWELAHARLGYRFRLHPPADSTGWTDPIDMAVGFFGTADMVFFELRRDIERDQARSLGYQDPLVLGAGAFIAFGNTTERFQYDVALGLGGALRGSESESNPDRRVIIAMLDADFQVEIGYGAALYFRPRVSGYFTRLSPATNFGLGLTSGLNIRF